MLTLQILKQQGLSCNLLQTLGLKLSIVPIFNVALKLFFWQMDTLVTFVNQSKGRGARMTLFT